MQTELVAVETVTDLSPALSLLQERKGRERANYKYARKIMQSQKDQLKIVTLILVTGITLFLFP